MQQLRLVGVSEDGASLLCADDDGKRFTLPLNDELRVAVRRDRRVPESSDGQARPENPLRPRDVQGLIRGGVPLEEVAERAGWSLEKVQRYEGPIRAERDYVSGLAQAVVLHGRGEVSTLRERADKRLAERDVEAERVIWDSWKSDDVHWTVVVRFPAGGRQREATWLFDPVGRALRTVDDEARWLGGDEIPSAGEERAEKATKSAKRGGRRAHEHEASVYDVEAEGGLDDAQAPHLGATMGSRDTGSSSGAPHDLAASMRARQASRGRSKGRGAAPRSSGASTPQPTDLTGTAGRTTPGSARVTRVERLDVGDTPPPLPSHPQPHEVEKALADDDAQDLGETAVKGAVVGDDPKTDASTSTTNADEQAHATDDDAEDTGASRRRRGRRPRSQAEPSRIREALDSDEDDRDESMFGELPGFHDGDDERAEETASTPDAEQDDAASTSKASEASKAPAVSADVENEAKDEDGDDVNEASAQEALSKRAPRAVPERQSQSRKSKSGRPSVPSWDDIMFGGRGPKK